MRGAVLLAALAGLLTTSSAIFVKCTNDTECKESGHGFDMCSNGGCSSASPRPVPRMTPTVVTRMMPTEVEEVLEPVPVLGPDPALPIVGGDPCTWGPQKCGEDLYWPGCKGSEFNDVCKPVPVLKPVPVFKPVPVLGPDPALPILGDDPCTWGPQKCGDDLYWPGCKGSDFNDVCKPVPVLGPAPPLPILGGKKKKKKNLGGDPCTWEPQKCGEDLYWPGCKGSDVNDVCKCNPCRARSLLFATTSKDDPMMGGAPDTTTKCC